MRVRVYATLRDLLGTAAVNLSLTEPTTVGQVLQTLVTHYPALHNKLWDATSSPAGFVTVLLNGRSVEWLQGLKTPVTDDDVLALFPPVGGG